MDDALNFFLSCMSPQYWDITIILYVATVRGWNPREQDFFLCFNFFLTQELCTHEYNNVQNEKK